MRMAWVGAVLALASCAVPAMQGDEAPRVVSEEREAASEAQDETANLQTQLATLRAQLAERERREVELRRELGKLTERLDRILELQKRTYQAVADKPENVVDYRALPPPTQRQLETRAIVRAIDRLDLTSEQKRALIQMLRTPRELDGDNPWEGTAEWH